MALIPALESARRNGWRGCGSPMPKSGSAWTPAKKTASPICCGSVSPSPRYRIDDEYLVRYGQSSLVNAFAENRANDLIKALATPNGNQGFVEMRTFVEKKGFSLNSTAGRKKLKAYLLANLARMQKEFLQAREQAKADRNQMFQHRGISLDTNLWPDYDLDRHLKSMLDKGMLKPGGIRRVAIVGPGLDFANKQEGLDFYSRRPSSPSRCWTPCFASVWLVPTRLALHSGYQLAGEPAHRSGQKECRVGAALYGATTLVCGRALDAGVSRQLYPVLAGAGIQDWSAGHAHPCPGIGSGR